LASCSTASLSLQRASAGDRCEAASLFAEAI
jgi:hypothetical protein